MTATWSTLLGVEVDRVDGATLGGVLRVAEVAVSGAFDGVLRLELSVPDAEAAARALLRVGRPTPDDVADVLGALAGAVAGQVVALLPASSLLGAPTTGEATRGTLLTEVVLAGAGRAVRVSVVQAG